MDLILSYSLGTKALLAPAFSEKMLSMALMNDFRAGSPRFLSHRSGVATLVAEAPLMATLPLLGLDPRLSGDGN